MRREIEDYFASCGIEYYSALSYEDIKEVNPGLRERAQIEGRSVIVFLLPYYAGEAENLSIYSASLDYHLIIKEITDGLISLLRKIYPENEFRGFGDHSPIDERDAALRAGLGILGDNGLIINEKYGSYIFIADVITDLEPTEIGAKKTENVKYCSHCGTCKNFCPTGVLRGESEECLSAITQKKGTLTPEEVELMRKYNTVWGCDLCQKSCPHNSSPKETPIEFFKKERITRLTKNTMEGLEGDAFSKRAFAWRGRAVVMRNLDLFED